MLAEDALDCAGSGDNMMSASGTGNIRIGVATVSLGTSGMICAFRIISDRLERRNPFCDGTDPTGCL